MRHSRRWATVADFLRPSLGADMESGIVTEWKIAPGDAVKRGDIVAEVETAKADIEIEVFEDGVIAELLAQEGERVAVGTPIARIVADSDAAAVVEAPVPPPRDGAAPVSPPPAAPVPPPPAAPVVPPEGSPAHHPRVSPVARRAADALHVDVSALHGSGPGGAISKRDVEQAAGSVAEPEEAVAAPEGDKASAMRAAIAALMARSKREVPHYYLDHEIDMSVAAAWLREHNAAAPMADRLIPGVLLLKAAARAARQVPELNGFWIDGSFRPADDVHLGVAVSLRTGGLVAPAIHHADEQALGDLMTALRDLARRARAGRMRQSEMADPTITVTSLGDQGVDAVHGVIYPPQVALVGFGRIHEAPRASGGMVGAREVVRATLAADHRASDGYSGARFLKAVDDFLQRPEEL